MGRHILVVMLCAVTVHITLGQNEESVRNEEFPDIGKLYQGDIILPHSAPQPGLSRNAIVVRDALWPKGKIPYIMHSNYTGESKKMLLAAMKDLEKSTCVHFIPWSEEPEYVHMTMVPGQGCVAMVGRHVGLGSGQQFNLEQPGCFRGVGVIQHELLHVIGLLHEQSRPDRDKYVQINWKNIPKKYWPDFSKGNPDEVSSFGLPYDYKSIMHYPKDAFSKNGKPTIVSKKDPAMELGQRKAPTKLDLQKVNKMYNCPGE